MTPPALPDPAAALLSARRLMRACNRVSLATLAGEAGGPYVSLAAVATDFDGAPLLLLSTLAEHTANLNADGRVALLFDGTAGLPNPQTGPRLTVTGRIAPSDEPRHRRRYLARHPGAALYAGFADFAMFRVAPERLRWVGGFGRALWLDGDLGIPPGRAEAFARAEAEMIGGGEADSPLAAALARASGLRGGGWRLAGADPDGVDLARGKTVRRVALDPPLDDPAQLRPRLVTLAEGGGR